MSSSALNNSLDDEFERIFKEEVGMAKVVLTPAAVEADFVSVAEAGESKTVKDCEAENEKLRMLNFKLVTFLGIVFSSLLLGTFAALACHILNV